MVMDNNSQVPTNPLILDTQELVKDIHKYTVKINPSQWVDLPHHIGIFHHKEILAQDQ